MTHLSERVEGGREGGRGGDKIEKKIEVKEWGTQAQKRTKRECMCVR